MSFYAKITVLVLIFSVAAMAGTRNDQRLAALDNGGVVKGSVCSIEGSEIPGAEIIVYSQSFSALDTVYCGGNGQFSFALESGSYYISAGGANHVRLFYPNVVMSNNAKPIHVASGQVLNLTFALEDGGIIAGTINTDDSQPSEFLISAIKIDHPYYLWQRDQIFRIGGQGDYSLDGLLPGYYKIFVRAEGYQTQFYDGAETFKEAQIVEVFVDQTLDNINFQLDQPGEGTISGYVSELPNHAPG